MKKKVFVYCPVNKRTYENRQKTLHKLHKWAEIAFDKEEEGLDMLWYPMVDMNIKSITECVDVMKDCDYFIGGYCVDQIWPEADLLMHIARVSGMEISHVDMNVFAPDMREIENEFWCKQTPVCEGNCIG